MEVTIASVDRQGIFKRKFFSTITVNEYLMVQHWTAFIQFSIRNMLLSLP